MSAQLLNFPQRITARRRPPGDHEIVVDSFAGAGGWGCGEEAANGWAVDVAINHDPLAIETHKANHPATLHYTSDVFEIDPRSVEPGRRIAHCHFSPDCTHHSKARGAAPVSDRVRGLAWIILAWMHLRRPRVVTMENVEEFRDWGPTADGKPIKEFAGRTFEAFKLAMTTGLRRDHPDLPQIVAAVGRWVPRAAIEKGMGYVFEDRDLRACDYGAPTIRKRFFGVGRCDGEPIVWPRPTHGPRDSEAVKAGELLPYVPAAEHIDFTKACPSIFMTKRHARRFKRSTGIRVKRPLVKNTCKRVAMGIKRHLIEEPDPFIIPFIAQCNHAPGRGGSRTRSAGEPFNTLTASRDAYGVVTPIVSRFNGQKGSESRCEDARDPASTIDTSNRLAAVQPSLAPMTVGVGGRAGQSRPRSGSEPAGTFTAKGDTAIAAATIARYGEREGQTPRSRDVQEPAATVVPSGNGAALVHAFLAKHFTGVVGQGLEEPCSTITTVDHQSLVGVTMLKNNFGGVGHSAKDPAFTLTTGNQQAAVASHMLKMRGTNKRGASLRDPGPTSTSGGNHEAIVSAILTSYYSSGSGKTGRAIDLPAPTATVTDRMAIATAIAAPMGPAAVEGFLRVWNFLIRYLGKDAPMPIVVIKGWIYLIIDIGMRMLTPRELLGLQFGEHANGWVLLGTQEQQTAGIGNSVCPHVAKAIVKANVKIRRVERGEVA